MKTTDIAFPNTDDTRTVAEVEQHIREANQRLTLDTLLKPGEPQRQQAAAWMAVVEVLDEINPAWRDAGGTGIENAVAAIRSLAAISKHEADKAAGVGGEFGNGAEDRVLDHFRAAIEASKPDVPEGYALVPTEILDRFPELNPSNYDHDDACELNAWGVELVLAAAPATPVQPEFVVPQKPAVVIARSDLKKLRAGDVYIRAWLPPAMGDTELELYTAPLPSQQPEVPTVDAGQARAALELAEEALGWHAAGFCEDIMPELTVEALKAIRAALPSPAPVPAAVPVERILAYLDDLKDDAAAHIWPEDLERCQTSECVVEVTSVRMGSPEGRTMPLFSREQVADAIRAASSAGEQA